MYIEVLEELQTNCFPFSQMFADRPERHSSIIGSKNYFHILPIQYLRNEIFK